MRLSNGEIIYTDPLNADTDGDGLKDGEEIIPQFKFADSSGIGLPGFPCGIYFKMNSDPTMSDTDGDGYNDKEDLDPLYHDYLNGLLYQSEKKMGIGYDGQSLADDLKTNDFTDSDLLKINHLFSYQNSLSENELEFDFRFMCNTFFAYGSYDMVNQLIDTFIYGSDQTISINTKDGLKQIPCYSNELLLQKVYEDEQVQKYIEYTKNEFINQIMKNDGNLILAKRNMEQIIEDSKVYKIAFSRNNSSYLFGGLTISINDLWGSNVCITNYSSNGTNFSGTLHFTLYDHFGLDKPDVEKIYGDLAGFRAWFELQHNKKYSSKFQPYINLMEYDVYFEGSF